MQQNLILFFPWIAPPALHPCTIQGKDQILPSGNFGIRRKSGPRTSSFRRRGSPAGWPATPATRDSTSRRCGMAGHLLGPGKQFNSITSIKIVWVIYSAISWFMCGPFLMLAVFVLRHLQGDTSGCSQGFVDMKIVVVFQFRLCILKWKNIVLMPKEPREQSDLSPCISILI